PFAARIRKIDTAGIITTIAGGDLLATAIGNGGPATSATLYAQDLAIDAAGNVYFLDLLTVTIRKVTPSGIITYVAGPFDGFAAQASLAIDASGNIYVAGSRLVYDGFGFRCTECPGLVIKVDPSGVVTTVADGGALAAAVARIRWDQSTGALYL